MSSQNELYLLLKETLQDAGLDNEELGIVYHCHLYAVSKGKYFIGHRMIIIIHKLIIHITKMEKKERN